MEMMIMYYCYINILFAAVIVNIMVGFFVDI